MERLAKDNINSGGEYDRIFLERKEKGINSQDLRRWKKLISKFRGGNLIDIGCLDSKIYDLLAQKFPENQFTYLGIDIAVNAMNEMKERYQNKGNVFFEFRDLFETQFSDGQFDYAVLGEVIEHLERPEAAVKESFRILKKGGILALSTPLEEIKEPGAVDEHRHLWSYSINDIINLLKPYGDVKTSVLGSEYFPEYVYHWPSILAFCKKK